MKTSTALEKAFGADFEDLIAHFCADLGLIADRENLRSERFLTRSLVPHIQRLSALFNRLDLDSGDQASGLAPYWKSSSNPANLMLAYFLYFMPCNLFRMAAILTELGKLGFQWKGNETELKGIEFGAGPASGAAGVAAGEKFSDHPLGLPKSGNWALIEQDNAVLSLGAKWATRYFEHLRIGDWGIREFHRKINPKAILPRNAPKFNLWIMSFVLNEFRDVTAEDWATLLIQAWERYLEDGGLIIILEPALKEQSRRLLEIRKELLRQIQQRRIEWLQILLPCLGHQNCGALENPTDWCHEEVSWWRPPYLKTIDQLAALDRKSLPFSYLVLTRSTRPRSKLLPNLSKHECQRLVSPARAEGKDFEFYICGAQGKRKARMKESVASAFKTEPNRGTILFDAEMAESKALAKIEKISGLLN